MSCPRSSICTERECPATERTAEAVTRPFTRRDSSVMARAAIRDRLVDRVRKLWPGCNTMIQQTALLLEPQVDLRELCALLRYGAREMPTLVNAAATSGPISGRSRIACLHLSVPPHWSFPGRCRAESRHRGDLSLIRAGQKLEAEPRRGEEATTINATAPIPITSQRCRNAWRITPR